MQKSSSSSSLGPGGLNLTQSFRQIQRAAPPSPSKRHTKISVVGAGNVDKAIAQTILTQDVADELVLVDAKADKLRGELLDLQHAAAFLPRTKLRDDHLDVNAQDVQLEPSQTVIDPNFENQIGGDLRNLESMEAIGGVVLEADGYQPYLISPEKGGGGGETSVQPAPSQTVIDLDSLGETSVQPPPSQTVIDPESLWGSLVQPPPSQPIVDREPPPNPINWAIDWQIPMMCFTTAIGIAIQSMEKEFQFPPSFHWLSPANSLTFSSLFIAKFVGRKSPAAVKVLEQVAVFLAVTIFFLAVAIPLPLHFKSAAWAIYAVTMIIVFICKIL